MRPLDALLTTVFAGEIGVAREDITPPAGIYARSWGAARHDVADGVHRPLTVTALALATPGGAPLLLLAADLGWWKSREDEWFVRGALIEALGLKASQLLISFSHTHAGPSLYREDAAKPGGALVAPYLALVRDRMLAAARAALERRGPARLSWRYGRCDLACNRDFPEPGASRYIVGHNPAVPADDTLLVGRIEDAADGRLLATLVNYACHPTTLAWDNRLISPDFPGAMRETVENATGAPCLFLQGASGELAPVEQYAGEVAVADQHGRRLGHAVAAVLESWPDKLHVFDRVVESGAALAVGRTEPAPASGELRAMLRTTELALKPLPGVAEIEAKLRDCTDRALSERLWRQRGVRRIVGDGATMALPVWMWRLGEAFVIAGPGEAYSVLQTGLRRRFPGRPIAVLNVTNGYVGYLAPHAHYARDQYSIWASPFAAGGLEALIETAAGLITQALTVPTVTSVRS